MHVQTKYVDCDMLADYITLQTSGKDISQNKCTLQDCLDQAANWCNSNSIASVQGKQKHPLSPLPLDLLLDRVNIEQVTEHRHLGIIIDNKLRWDSHTDSMCKTHFEMCFRLSKRRYVVDTDTRKKFLNAHIKPYIVNASVLWCSDALNKRLNSLNRRAGKLILMNTNQSIDQALTEPEIMSNWNITRVCSCIRPLITQRLSIIILIIIQKSYIAR